MAFDRFLQLGNLAVKAKQEQAQDALVQSAFIGWQMGAGGKVKLGEYLHSLGLSDSLPQQPDTPAVEEKEDDTEALRRMGIEVKKVKGEVA